MAGPEMTELSTKSTTTRTVSICAKATNRAASASAGAVAGDLAHRHRQHGRSAGLAAIVRPAPGAALASIAPTVQRHGEVETQQSLIDAGLLICAESLVAGSLADFAARYLRITSGAVSAARGVGDRSGFTARMNRMRRLFKHQALLEF